jgi:hypothetical protein
MAWRCDIEGNRVASSDLHDMILVRFAVDQMKRFVEGVDRA